MALKPLQAHSPLGQFDALDASTTTVKGGEVAYFGSVVNTVATDKAASDSFDGYANPNLRTVVKLATTGTASVERPLMLVDDGIAGYGTLFGTVVGGTVGQVSYGPNSTISAGGNLGPHTATGSGKLTCWASPGLYAVSLDAVDTTASTGLMPTNASMVPGTQLFYSTSSLLTSTSSKASSTAIVGTFVEFTDNGSLVSTPNNLVGTISTPNGAVTSSSTVLSYAVIWFNPAS